MPNWCSCSLEVKADTGEEIEKFIKKVRGKNGGEYKEQWIDFQKIDPMPKEFEENGEGQHPPGFTPEWYRWRCQHWGTKWNADCKGRDDWSSSIQEGKPSSTWLCFETAWSPPISLVKTLAKKFPKLHFELQYIETGNQFAGIVTGKRILGHEQYDGDSPGYKKINKEFGEPGY